MGNCAQGWEGCIFGIRSNRGQKQIRQEERNKIEGGALGGAPTTSFPTKNRVSVFIQGGPGAHKQATRGSNQAGELQVVERWNVVRRQPKGLSGHFVLVGFSPPKLYALGWGLRASRPDRSGQYRLTWSYPGLCLNHIRARQLSYLAVSEPLSQKEPL